jgi:hypothetical protein
MIPAVAAAVLAAAPAPSAAQESRLFELRIYTAHPGKLDALNARFRDHTVRLFEKHGMTNLGYWVPTPNPDNKLYYVLAHKDRAARNASFKSFVADPEWKTASAASEKDGKLVAKIEEMFLTATDYSPAVELTKSSPPRLFELRTYTATPGNLEALNSRFRDHTVNLFAKHGMTNLWYWTLAEGSKDRDVTLVYLLAHPSREARDKAFAAFRDDPAWVSARNASEAKAGGSLTVKDGVKSVLMMPTDYSPIR